MRSKIWRVVRWVVYPLFYLFCLLIFVYLTFPYEALKNRLVSDFNQSQQRRALRGRSGDDPVRLEIGKLTGYWVTGVEVEDAKVIVPPRSKRKNRLSSLAGGADEPPAKDAVIVIDSASARLQVLPLLLGRVRINFDAEALGGNIEGSVPYGDSGDAEITIDGVQLAKVEPLSAMLQGIPISGTANGSLTLTAKEGKFSKADGRLSVRIDDVVLGLPGKNGKLEVQGTSLPSPQIGQIVLEAGAKDGLLTIEEMQSRGRDAEIVGEGKVKLHESWGRAAADVFLKFRFSDVYRNSDPTVTGLLGKPGDKFPPAIEVAPGSPFPQAKTEDGFYRFHIHGALATIDTDPAGSAAPPSRTNRGAAARGARAGQKSLGGLLGRRPRPVVRPPEPKVDDKGDEGDDGKDEVKEEAKEEPKEEVKPAEPEEKEP